MATYRFQFSDEFGQVVGIHFAPFENSADAQRFADDLLAGGKYIRVEYAEINQPDELVRRF